MLKKPYNASCNYLLRWNVSRGEASTLFLMLGMALMVKGSLQGILRCPVEPSTLPSPPLRMELILGYQNCSIVYEGTINNAHLLQLLGFPTISTKAEKGKLLGSQFQVTPCDTRALPLCL